MVLLSAVHNDARHWWPAMGIAWYDLVYLYSDPEKSDRQDVLLDSLQTALDNMDAKQAGFFSLTSETFFSTTTTNAKPVHLFQSSEFPETTFVLVGDTLGSASTFLFAEKSITQMIRNLDGAYCTKPISKVECRGNKYVISDFTVRTSVATIASNFKGILVEIEYRPCVAMQLCGDLMKEFCTALLGSAASAPPTFVGLTKPNQRYVPIDTIFQYHCYFMHFRKMSVQTAGPNEQQSQAQPQPQQQQQQPQQQQQQQQQQQ
ncbi:Mediator of RNA polymerase II transcription subunit 20 [Trichinella britovi]|uniref:Mediator of RNA polymerase II transcription subunit 20 n=1 Tax=Trichinella britovi TaxID=45882 RepID=A0A0V1CDX3_TRIBR|nr:Mediator of RNA polymerase II transcription subunit 20 [Trichinella britovi]